MLIKKSREAGACSASSRKAQHLRFALLASLAAGLLINSPLHALTFPVNSTADAVDASPGDGRCATTLTGTTCTLRAAIMEANALPGADTITLLGATYTLTISGRGEDSARSGDLDVTGGGDLTIQGVSSASTRISAGGSFSQGIDRVFHFIGKNNVTISNVSIEKGYVSGAKGNGGGIFNQTAWVTLSNCQITGNATVWSDTARSGGQGGGIYNALGAKMTINTCTIKDNSTQDSGDSNEPGFNGGGGVFNGGDMTMLSTVVDNNTTYRNGAGILNEGTLVITKSIVSNNRGPAGSSNQSSRQIFGMGGGIANDGGIVTLRDSLVTGNTSIEGGGILNLQIGMNVPEFNIITSTVSSNAAEQWGGGIDNWGVMRISYSAIYKNTAGFTGNSSGSFGSFFGGPLLGDGGGIRNMGIGEMLVAHSTISHNIANRAGGGLINGAKARLLHVTLANNKAGSGPVDPTADDCIGFCGGGGFGGGFGGGGFGGGGSGGGGSGGSYVLGNEVFIDQGANSNNKATIFESTIIAGGASLAGNCLAGRAATQNFAPALLEAPTVPFPSTSNGYNIDSGNTCGLVAAKNDKISTSPQLVAVADFGEGAVLPAYLSGISKVPQWMYMLNTGSPAINAIPINACPKPGVDQRLYVRPDVPGGSCDIGAVEVGITKASIADLNIAVSFATRASASLKAFNSSASMSYAITVTNNGPQGVSGLIVVTQVFDADVSLGSYGPRQAAVACNQVDGRTVTCGYSGGLAADKSFDVYVTVSPSDLNRKALSSTATVSYPDLGTTIDPVSSNDSVTVERSVTVTDPFPNSTGPGGFTTGGGGAFGVLPLTLLGMFGAWRGYRRSAARRI